MTEQVRNVLSRFFCYYFSLKHVFGIPEKTDPGPYEDPGAYEDPGPQEDLGRYEDQGPQQNPGPQEDSGPYDNLEFFDGPGKAQKLINQLKFLDFHTMCLIWWNLQLKGNSFKADKLNIFFKTENMLEIKREQL